MILLHDLDNNEILVNENSIVYFQWKKKSEYYNTEHTYIQLNDAGKSYFRVLETFSEISALLSSKSKESKSEKALQLIINLINNTDIDEISNNYDFIEGYKLATEKAINIIRQFKDY